MALSIGIDLGGTGIFAALVDRQGRLRATEDRATPVKEGPVGVIRTMLEMAAALVTQADQPVIGIGLGIPGLLDPATGTTIFSPNLFWQDVQVLAPFRERFGIPVAMENDVRVATMGELHFGAGRGIDTFLFTALGTGVGSGIVIEGKLYRGPYGTAGEFGHIPIRPSGDPCNCGGRGCLEALVSGPAIRRRALRAIAAGRDAGSSILRDLVSEQVTARTVADAARAGDPLACRIMTEVGTDLGLGIAAYYTLMCPEAVIVGGGVALAGDLLLAPAHAVAVKRLMPGIRERVRILPAELGDESGAVGAATLVPGFMV
jgi:glucokinase